MFIICICFICVQLQGAVSQLESAIKDGRSQPSHHVIGLGQKTAPEPVIVHTPPPVPVKIETIDELLGRYKVLSVSRPLPAPTPVPIKRPVVPKPIPVPITQPPAVPYPPPVVIQITNNTPSEDKGHNSDPSELMSLLKVVMTRQQDAIDSNQDLLRAMVGHNISRGKFICIIYVFCVHVYI